MRGQLGGRVRACQQAPLTGCMVWWVGASVYTWTESARHTKHIVCQKYRSATHQRACSYLLSSRDTQRTHTCIRGIFCFKFLTFIDLGCLYSLGPCGEKSGGGCVEPLPDNPFHNLGTHTHTHIRKHDMYIYVHTYTQIHTHVYTCTHTHTHTHTQAHTHTHTHTHTLM
jgi:hypothetical protein